MSVYYAVAGDDQTTVDATLGGITAIPNGTTIVAHLRSTAAAASTITHSVTITDYAARRVRITITAADALPAGDYQLEWYASFPDTSDLTWPSDGTDVLRVRARL